MTAAQVIDNEICFKHTEYDSIVELFNSRAQMHKRVCGGHTLAASTALRSLHSRNDGSVVTP